MEKEQIQMSKDTVLFVIEHKLKDCSEFLKSRVEYYSHTPSKQLSDEELDYANMMFSLYDRINGVLEYIEHDKSIRNNSESNG
jgi:hypothetical protein